MRFEPTTASLEVQKLRVVNSIEEDTSDKELTEGLLPIMPDGLRNIERLDEFYELLKKQDKDDK